MACYDETDSISEMAQGWAVRRFLKKQGTQNVLRDRWFTQLGRSSVSAVAVRRHHRQLHNPTVQLAGQLVRRHLRLVDQQMRIPRHSRPSSDGSTPDRWLRLRLLKYSI